MQNADPIQDRGDYAHNFDESGLFRGQMTQIVEESLIGRNMVRLFQKEINEIVEDHVPPLPAAAKKDQHQDAKSHQETLQEAGSARPLG
jgi:hypothetical protein